MIILFNYRQPVPVEKRVMIALWRLATNIEYRSLGRMFGIGTSTACEITMDFVEAVVRHLMPIYVRIPQDQLRMVHVIDGFRNKWGMPQCGGAIDGTHLPILAPAEYHTDYFNRKGWHSIIMQAVVDHEYQFMDVMVGFPGSVHDARVFSHSSLFQRGLNGTLFPDLTDNISGVDIPIYLIGDPAYPLLPWLIKGFPRNDIDPGNTIFNHQLSSARMVVENAFGRLKGRWRCLLKRYDGRLVHMNNIVSACVTLHNICEKHNERFQEEWLEEVRDADLLLPQPPRQNIQMDERGNHAIGIRYRNALKEWVQRIRM